MKQPSLRTLFWHPESVCEPLLSRHAARAHGAPWGERDGRGEAAGQPPDGRARTRDTLRLGRAREAGDMLSQTGSVPEKAFTILSSATVASGHFLLSKECMRPLWPRLPSIWGLGLGGGDLLPRAALAPELMHEYSYTCYE